MSIQVDSLILCLLLIFISHSQAATSDMQTKLVDQIITQGNATETSIADLKHQNEVTEKQLSDVLIKLSRLEEFLITPASTCNMEIQRSESESDLSELKLQNKATNTELINVFIKLFKIEETMNSSASTSNIEIQRGEAQSDLSELKLQSKATDTELINVLRKLFTIEESMNSSASILDRLDELIVKLETLAGKVEQGNVRQRQQDTAIDAKLDRILSNIEKIPTVSQVTTPTGASQMRNVPQDSTLSSLVKTTEVNNNQTSEKLTCYKRMPSQKTRETFTLWDNIPALCDTDTECGGWIIIQRRTKGDVNFYRSWNNYKDGFGTLETDYWIGNEIIHNLTSQGYTDLRIEMEYEGKQYFAHYSNFNLADEKSKYQITVDTYYGTAGNSLKFHNGSYFSTYDRDNDIDYRNCAAEFHAAWWYKNCYHSNLNGLWASQSNSGVVWRDIKSGKSLSFTEMKIRRV